MKNKDVTPTAEALPAPEVAQIIYAKPDSEKNFNAHLATRGSFTSSMVVNSYLDLSKHADEMYTALHEQAKAVNAGDMTQVESMLIGQAVALQSMFTDLALKARRAKSMQEIQCLTQLALRSQAGSRSTLQTLSDVKNPKQVAFIKQTNVAQTQQVNNGVLPSSHAENIKAIPNELLVEESHGRTTLDTRAKTEAGRAYPAVVTLDRVDRPAKRRRQTKIIA